MNFNGEGSLSPLVLLQTCTTPSLLKPPTISYISIDLVTIIWEEPQSNGGCPILGYRIYSNQGSVINTFIEVDPTQVAGKPFLSNYDIVTTTWTVSERYQLKIGAYNHVDLLVSDSIEFLLASIPSTPALPTRITDG